MWNKLYEIFTKKYRKETKYIETERSMICGFKLKTASESVNDKVKRLLDKKFISSFKLNR